MTYRNKNLLQWAKHCPYCMRCHRGNTGTIVAAHSNQLRDGKGMGIKAHDFRVAFLCHTCHAYIDQSGVDKEKKYMDWRDAHYETIGWLFQVGALTVENPE